MITMALPLPVGNALRVFMAAPDDAVLTRVLRKTSDTFTGIDDPGAVHVADTTDNNALDVVGLVNGTPYFYRAYHFNGLAWFDSGLSVQGTPAATYVDRTVDVQSLLRDRIDAGLKVEIARGALVPQTNKIPVVVAPPIFDQKRLPMVIVHLENEAPAQTGIGDILLPDELDVLSGQWEESTGWMARTQLTITAWSLNPDERLNLRKALRRVLTANKPVFESLGLISAEFPMSDMEDFTGFDAPIYQVTCSFSCLAPVLVADLAAPVSDVAVDASTY